MWLPSTVKVPPDPVIVPTEFGEPSPQSMMAVKSAGTLNGVGVGESADGAAEEHAGIQRRDQRARLRRSAAHPAMTASEAPSTVIGVAPALSVTNTSTWYVPDSGIAEPGIVGAVTVYCAALPFWVMLAVPGIRVTTPPGLTMSMVAE